MSEKMDGVRAYWDGHNMFSRNGNKFYPPSYFRDILPKGFALDGELWTERNDFERCVSIVKR
jgi:DNA ligase-1